jgi:hypothetical protein
MEHLFKKVHSDFYFTIEDKIIMLETLDFSLQTIQRTFNIIEPTDQDFSVISKIQFMWLRLKTEMYEKEITLNIDEAAILCGVMQASMNRVKEDCELTIERQLVLDKLTGLVDRFISDIKVELQKKLIELL